MDERPKERTSRWALVAVSTVLAVCLLGCVACVAGQPAMQQWPAGFGYSMTFCFIGPPNRQVGVKWVSPFISSALPPFGGAANGCYTVPYLPFLPQRGEILFPP